MLEHKGHGQSLISIEGAALVVKGLIAACSLLFSMSVIAQNQVLIESPPSPVDYSKWSLAIAGFALLISVLSLLANRHHNKISVVPKLVFRLNTDSKNGKLSVTMFNKGVGPLTFTKFEMRYNGTSFYIFSDLFHAIRGKLYFSKDDFDKNHALFSYGLDDYVLTINERKVLLKFQLLRKTKTDYYKFYDEVKKVEFVYSYKDLYEKETKVIRYPLTRIFPAR